jgi:hypothetical protein
MLVSVDDLLSRALRLFVTREPHGFPHLDPDRLEQEFGGAAAELRPKLEALVTEMLALPFQGEDLMAATRAAEAAMSARHPELGPDAVAALGFYYGYCWR